MKISIVCGEKHCGKTTFLQNEFLKKSDIELSHWTGFFTPIIENERNFVFVQNYESINMEYVENQEDELSVGRFVFSKKAFEKAINYIQNDLRKGIKNCNNLAIKNLAKNLKA